MSNVTRNAVLEEAAKIADNAAEEWASDAKLLSEEGMNKTATIALNHSAGASMVAIAIRALKECQS